MSPETNELTELGCARRHCRPRPSKTWPGGVTHQLGDLGMSFDCPRPGFSREQIQVTTARTPQDMVTVRLRSQGKGHAELNSKASGGVCQ